MGQRSQMFVQVQPSKHASSQSPRREGRHYHWVWGPHMIIRAAQVVRLLETATETKAIRYWSAAEATAGIIATYSVNQATGEVQGLSPYDDVSGARHHRYPVLQHLAQQRCSRAPVRLPVSWETPKSSASSCCTHPIQAQGTQRGADRPVEPQRWRSPGAFSAEFSGVVQQYAQLQNLLPENLSYSTGVAD